MGRKYVIGISSHYHDSSACLFIDNQLVFACEEEKFTGIKHDSSFPENVISHIFKKYKITKNDIDAVCYYESPELKYKRVVKNIKDKWYTNPLYSIKSYIKIKLNLMDLKKNLSKISDNIFYSTHHESHIYYSLFSSYFKNATCLSIDGVGEMDTISIGQLKDNKVEYKSISQYPHSLGLFYSAMTSFLGFKPNEGEYKVMGLASYGDPKKYMNKVNKLITFKDGKILCDMNVFCWDRSDRIMFTHKLSDVLNIENRLPEEEITQDHMDLASSIQKKYEDILFGLINLIEDETNLTLSGGCAYNGTANGKIVNNSHIEKLWIPPAPSDAGSSIGACLHYLVKHQNYKHRLTKNPFLGPIYYDKHIRSAIGKLRYRKFVFDSKLRKHIAKELNDGKVVGWFQGHCEFGARALGNRSILANPTLEGMKDRINKLVKKREGFRPFAPMVQKEHQHKFFEMTDDVPYMNQVVKVKNEYKNILKSVTHVDGTARVQTVYSNTLIHGLLSEFEKVSGFPILLNTSFNIKDKTMVLTPEDAVQTFLNTDIDILVMNNYVLYKKNK